MLFALHWIYFWHRKSWPRYGLKECNAEYQKLGRTKAANLVFTFASLWSYRHKTLILHQADFFFWCRCRYCNSSQVKKTFDTVWNCASLGKVKLLSKWMIQCPMGKTFKTFESQNYITFNAEAFKHLKKLLCKIVEQKRLWNCYCTFLFHEFY